MLDFRSELETLVASYLADQGVSPETSPDLALETPPDPEMGDLAVPCFPLARVLRRPPNTIAADVAAFVAARRPPWLAEVRAIGGYVNVRFLPSALAEDVIKAIEAAGERYGGGDAGRGKTVVIDFSSPNIAKPFSIGHIRSTVIGHSLARIYSSLGWRIVRVNHLGDWGTQFGKQIVAYKLWGAGVDLGTDAIEKLLQLYIRFHEEAETDPKLEEMARFWFKKLEDGDDEAVALWKRFRELSLAEFRRVYDLLGIEFDAYTGESFYNDMLESTVRRVEEAGLTRVSNGAVIVPLDEYDLPPCLLKKTDGATLYATRDIAAAIYRHNEYHFDRALYVVGMPQQLHFKQVFATLAKLGEEWVENCLHVPFGIIRYGDEVVSTRRGNLIFLEDVLTRAINMTREIIERKNPDLPGKDEVARAVGIGAVVFADLRHNRVKDIDFSWDDVLNFEGDTGPYVQYSHARACSVLRRAGVATLAPSVAERGEVDVDWPALNTREETELLKKLAAFPEAVRAAAAEDEPSTVARYLLDLCRDFNTFYHAHRVVGQEAGLERARLRLVAATRQVLANGLSLLGMDAPESM